MATIRVPPNVSSVTFATSGVKTPTSNIITGITAQEATDVTSAYSNGPNGFNIVNTNLSTGVTTMWMPASITSITINGNVYSVTNKQITGVPAADVANIITGSRQRYPIFELVQG